MPKVVIEPSKGAALTIDAPSGGSLADLCDAHNAPVPFSCRSASCGTCRCEVLEGADLLTKPEDEELDVLDMLGAPKRDRLACCAKLVVARARFGFAPSTSTEGPDGAFFAPRLAGAGPADPFWAEVTAASPDV